MQIATTASGAVNAIHDNGSHIPVWPIKAASSPNTFKAANKAGQRQISLRRTSARHSAAPGNGMATAECRCALAARDRDSQR